VSAGLPTMGDMKKLGIVAAGLFVAYGIVRLVDGRDGEHGPGTAWTVGHLLFLVGILLYGVMLVRARGLLRARRGLGAAAVVVGMVGVAAFVRVFVVDLIVGFRAEDHAAMSRIGDEYERWPGDLGIYEPLYTVGPLFLAGLLTLAVLLTVERQIAGVVAGVAARRLRGDLGKPGSDAVGRGAARAGVRQQ
jgi:hypothetical protein